MILLLVLLCHSWFGPDIWYHLTWGRNLLEQGTFIPSVRTLIPQPMHANLYWLFQMSIYFIYRAGQVYAVSLVFAVLWVWIAWGWWRLLRVRRLGWLGGLLVVGVILLAQQRFEARPEVISYALLAALLLVLQDLDLRKPLTKGTVLAVVLLEALWANCHGFAFFGIVVVGVIASAQAHHSWRRASGLILASALGWLSTPYGIGVVPPLLDYASVAQGLRSINAELMAPSFWPPSFPFSLVWILVALNVGWSLVCLVKKREIVAILFASLGVALLLGAVRNLPLFLILSAPLWGDFLRQKCLDVFKFLNPLPALLALALSGWVMVGGYHAWTRSLGGFGVELEPSAYPIQATEVLQRLGFQGLLFTDSYDGGYVEFQMPTVRVAGDSYFSSVRETLRYFSAIRDPAALRALDQEFHFDGLLINIENRDEVEAVLHDPSWSLVHADLYRLLWLRGGAPLNLATVNFTPKRALRWMDQYALTRWGELAWHERDRDLMLNLCRDFKAADSLPEEFLVAALSLAVMQRDHELALAALELTGPQESSFSKIRDLIESAKRL